MLTGMAPSEEVSRPLLAQSRLVHMMTGLIMAGASCAAWLLAYIVTGSLTRGLPALVAGLLVVLIFIPRSAPAIGSSSNHLLLAACWLLPIITLWQVLPHSAAALGGFAIPGVLIPFRLVERRHIVGHLSVFTVLVLIPVVAGLADRHTNAGVLLMVPMVWGMAAAVMLVLEAAEKQSVLLSQLVRRDPLTGAGNRRMLYERMAYEIRRHRRNKQPFAVIAFDLNGFKAINDVEGHAAGDDLLRAVATTLTAGVRHQDSVVRQGGDEFCVLLPETGREQGELLAGKLAAALSDIQTSQGPLSTGWGVAAFPGDGEKRDELLNCADMRLLANKQSSRGQAAAD